MATNGHWSLWKSTLDACGNHLRFALYCQWVILRLGSEFAEELECHPSL